MCLLCHSARAWILPLLYDTITLDSSERIEWLAYALMRSDDEIIVDHLPALFIRKLWIGHTSSFQRHDLDLDYGSTAWPITLIHQILTRCLSLRSLAVIGIGQARWYRLTGVIPPSVTSLTLGPVHGEVDYRHMPCAPNLCRFTSLDTFMLDTEIRDLVLSPTIHTIRRIYSSGDRVDLAMDQLECVAQATVLERLEIVCYANSREEAASLLDAAAEGREYDRDRVVLVPQSSVRAGGRDAIATMFEDWEGGEG